MPTDAPILIDLPMPIVTPRLVLRPAMPGDGAATHAAIEETYEQVRPWMPWAKERESADVVEANIRQARARFILREDFRMNGCERDGGRMVVFTGLHEPDWKVRQFEIGYWVRTSAQGQGYAAEAANALARYAFGVLHARRVVVGHGAGNAASEAIIRKLGFELEGVRRGGHSLPDDAVVDDYRYVLLSADRLPPLDVSWDREPG